MLHVHRERERKRESVAAAAARKLRLSCAAEESGQARVSCQRAYTDRALSSLSLSLSLSLLRLESSRTLGLLVGLTGSADHRKLSQKASPSSYMI